MFKLISTEHISTIKANITIQGQSFTIQWTPCCILLCHLDKVALSATSQLSTVLINDKFDYFLHSFE